MQRLQHLDKIAVLGKGPYSAKCSWHAGPVQVRGDTCIWVGSRAALRAGGRVGVDGELAIGIVVANVNVDLRGCRTWNRDWMQG